MNIVLLNPPGRKIYVRNYYCPSTSKANYLFQPLDLMMMSGRLAQEHRLSVVDAIASRIGPEACLKRVIGLRPEGIVMLAGSASWDEDRIFIRKLKTACPDVQIVVSADLFFGDTDKHMRSEPGIDAAVFDFTSDDIIHYFRGDTAHITNMAFRANGTVCVRRRPVKGGALFHLPKPRHELFLHKNYRFPFVRHYPYTTVMTNFGCPYRCNFCIASVMDFRYRPHEEVLDELCTIRALGIRELFFEDFTFGLPKAESRKLLEGMISRGLDFSWTCYSRVDTTDEVFLRLMKKAGCHTVIFGVESADDHILAQTLKGICSSEVVRAFRSARSLGIRTVATFVLGLPQETRASCLKTIAFAKALDPDYASFNVAVPRSGTLLSRQVRREGLHADRDPVFDHSGERIAMPTRTLMKHEVAALRRRAILEFYLRPGYILRRLRGVSTWTGFREHVTEGAALIGKCLKFPRFRRKVCPM